jgi:hypothetical protein
MALTNRLSSAEVEYGQICTSASPLCLFGMQRDGLYLYNSM